MENGQDLTNLQRRVAAESARPEAGRGDGRSSDRDGSPNAPEAPRRAEGGEFRLPPFRWLRRHRRVALATLIAGSALLAGLLIGGWRAGADPQVVQCGDGIVVCPPSDGRSVLVRIHGRWYVAGYGSRSGWVGGKFPAGQWPDAWVELPEEARDH